ncbi:uncharacterized protein JCM6883_005006 [Sporobolomyces salmoneus]|uniref:uncharacterized protein n=1 Tax=Sporobolomyces salmoneus TaxID=183962 RepID=UPI003172D65A
MSTSRSYKPDPDGHATDVKNRRLLPIILLSVALASYTLQTELASYVQHTLDYKKPYFLFFCTHSGYMLLWPCHLLALRVLKIPVKESLRDLLPLLAQHFAPSSPSSSSTKSSSSLPTSTPSNDFPFPLKKTSTISFKTPWVRNLVQKVALLTIFISFPALSWYASVPLTSMADLTAIYNVFAFWAYLLSLKFLPTESTQTPFQARLKLFSVLLAVSGVFVIAYGDVIWGGNDKSEEKGSEGSNRVLGNGLALFGSLAYAGYEVWYKIKIALPEPSTSSTSSNSRLSETSSLLSTRSSSPIPDIDPPTSSSAFEFPPPPSPSFTLTNSLSTSSQHSSSSTLPTLAPSPTLFLLYSNLITSLIGLLTFLFLWIPIPFLNLIGWEIWEGFPPRAAWGALVGIVGGGVLFNGCFMVLLSLWGPVVASVANLLTLILVALCDALFVPTAPPLTKSSLIGGGLIVVAFAGLIWGEYGTESEEDGMKHRRLGSEEGEEEDEGRR